MARIKWTLQAIDDIDAICKFIARDSEYYAHLFANQIMEKTSILAAFPNAGRVVPELNDNTIRELIHGNYRIIYRVLAEETEILTVHHSARLLDSMNLEKSND